MAQQPNDVWALGLLLEYILTSARLSWQTASGSVSGVGDGMCTEHTLLAQESLLKEQALWAAAPLSGCEGCLMAS